MPEPGQKITVRLPPALHTHLTAVAAEQGVSLNALLVALLAGGSAWPGTPRLQRNTTHRGG